VLTPFIIKRPPDRFLSRRLRNHLAMKVPITLETGLPAMALMPDEIAYTLVGSILFFYINR
jgi:hypothetical protein